MTDKEAIYCIKSMSDYEPEVCEECPIYGQTGSDHCSEEALRLAIKALEKQIARESRDRMWIVDNRR